MIVCFPWRKVATFASIAAWLVWGLLGAVVFAQQFELDASKIDPQNRKSLAKQALKVKAMGVEAEFLVVKVTFKPNQPFTGRAISSLIEFRRTIQALVVLSSSVEPSGLDAISHFWKLTNLTVRSESVDDQVFKALRGLRHLTSLDLSSTSITGDGLSTLKDVPLLDLDVSGTKLSQKGMSELSSLTSLETLSIGNLAITDDSLLSLANLTKLKSLNLAMTRISDLRPSADSEGKWSNLLTLSVSHTLVNDGLIESIEHMPKLTMLHVDSTNITDEGIGKLLRYKDDNPFLQTLTVSPSQISAETVAKLKKAFPVLTIYGVQPDGSRKAL